jgi:hemerythrin
VLANQFTLIFREEHRKVRDLLLDLIEAFRGRDHTRIQALLKRVAVLTGSHFRYEEEALYPALVGIFEAEYVEHLLSDHDRAIGTARKLVELAGKEPLTDADVAEAVHLVCPILPHVSDCDGLSIMVERLPEEKIQSVFEARDRSRRSGFDLFRWASYVRNRPAVIPT